MRTEWIKTTIVIGAGSALYALSVSSFSTPNDIAPGGAGGVGVLLHALWGVPVGAVVLAVNLPLLLAAFYKLSHGFAFSTAAVLLVSSGLIDLFAEMLPPLTEDRLLAAVGGGLLSGVGVGWIVRCGASTGGSDIVAALWRRRQPHLSMGTCVLLVDATVIALSAAVFGTVSAALYAAVSVFVASLAIDRVVYGREEGRLLLVVTDRERAVVTAITDRLHRGVTVVDATGGYSGQGRHLLFCAVRPTQLPTLKRLVRESDPTAFAMVVTTRQVVGKGFLSDED